MKVTKECIIQKNKKHHTLDSINLQYVFKLNEKLPCYVLSIS